MKRWSHSLCLYSDCSLSSGFSVIMICTSVLAALVRCSFSGSDLMCATISCTLRPYSPIFIGPRVVLYSMSVFTTFITPSPPNGKLQCLQKFQSMLKWEELQFNYRTAVKSPFGELGIFEFSSKFAFWRI